jgi:hypothetical protein
VRKNPIISKFSKTNKKKYCKIFPGPKQCARNITNEKSAFDKFFTDRSMHIPRNCKIENTLSPAKRC